MKYKVEVRDQYGHLVADILRPQNKQLSVYRNRPGSIQFTMDLLDPQANDTILKLNQYDIVFRRYGTPICSGQLSYLNPQVDGDKKTLEVIATGYMDLFDQRFVTEDYNGFDALHQNLPYDVTDAGAVIADLISNSQFPLSTDGAYTSTGTGLTLCQSFVTPNTANVVTIKLLLQKQAATGNMVVGIYTDSNDSPASLVTNSQKTLDVSGISTDLGWYTITYTTLPALTAGTKYWIKVYLDTTQSGSNGVYWSYLDNNNYIAGRAYSPENPSLFTSDEDLQFFIKLDDNSFQMTKNTYYNIEPGTINTSFDITPVYPIYKKIKSAIEDICNTHNGPDFDITYTIDNTTNIMTKTFNVFYPRQGVDNTNLNFSYPGNIKKFTRTKDGKTMLNDIAMIGQGYGLGQLVENVSDASSIQTYAQRQDVEHAPDVSDPDILLKHAQEFLRIRKDPLDLPEVVLDGTMDPQLGSYGVGDQILIQVTGIPMLEFMDIYRIEKIDCTISDDDLEEIALMVSLA